MSRRLSLLSKVWMPTGAFKRQEMVDGHTTLIRAGFIRQSSPGVFHLMPLGNRVQEKLERLIALHMEDTLGASRVSLSSISTEALWRKSGRFANIGSELFKFNDRGNVPYLLAPTHEEEITALVAETIKSKKDLPLRLYQITRKYRDELRPRNGLLRGREFTMKDLYTFDVTVSAALKTYNQVRQAYVNLFKDLKLPILVADASSGDMGGDLSHEYHLPSQLGEDNVLSCNECDYVSNEESASARVHDMEAPTSEPRVWRGITKDRSTLVNVWFPCDTSSPEGGRSYDYEDVNIYAVKAHVPDLDAGRTSALQLWQEATTGPTPTAKSIVNLVDARLAQRAWGEMWPSSLPKAKVPLEHHFVYGNEQEPLNLIRIREGDACPRCSSGELKAQKAIELGHTFHLGIRYSEPLGCTTQVPTSELQAAGHDLAETAGGKASQVVPLQMGCHGIGVSRVIGAIAEHLHDSKGLVWPAAIAPYSCAIIPSQTHIQDAVQLYRQLMPTLEASAIPMDAVVDDRDKSMGWKLIDADFVGFPVVIILGKTWEEKKVEVQVRKLGIKEVVDADEVPQLVAKLLARV